MTLNRIDEDVDIAVNRLNITELDTPIYRVFPLWFFEESLRLKRLTLVQPSSWEDPYEVLGDAVAVDYWEGQKRIQTIVNQDLPPAYAQCWSKTEESDTLLRAYSRVDRDSHFGRNVSLRYEGVKIKSTVRKLIRAVSGNTERLPKGETFIGLVQYKSHDDILQSITDTIARDGLNAYKKTINRANLLTLKRKAFSYESEVRMIFICKAQRSESLLHISIEPADVFEEITFDPRLTKFEQVEREAWARQKGYNGVVRESDLYQRTLLQIAMPESFGSRQQ